VISARARQAIKGSTVRNKPDLRAAVAVCWKYNKACRPWIKGISAGWTGRCRKPLLYPLSYGGSRAA